jgi:PTS system cellobiose-specific IIB component
LLKILLCCGGGFSSSAIATRMQKEIVSTGRENKYYIEFFPFGSGYNTIKEKLQEFDVAILCPHLKMEFMQMQKKGYDFDKPVYLLPPKVYGMMKLDEIITDVEDVITMYNKNPINPVVFPGEENLLKIKRAVAYRNYYKEITI